MDIVSFALDVPAYVANFANTCRTIKDYRDLDKSYIELMNRAISNSKRLENLTSIIREPNDYPTEARQYISRLLMQAKSSLENTMKVVTDWQRRLGIQDIEAETKKKRLLPSFSSCFGKKLMEDVKEKPTFMQERLAEAEYMITGQLEIKSLMESLEHYLTDLNFAILTSNHLSPSPTRARGTSTNIEFVARAKSRVASDTPITLIDCNELEPLSDIDLGTPTGIYTVDTGRYSGCIVDPRNVTRYMKDQKEEIAWEETRNIARLFMEDRDAPDSSLSSSVGILPSCGYTELETNLHAIVFRLPYGCTPPRTLRSLLVEGKVNHSLGDRVQFCIRLATSVLVVHTLGLVHKCIKPDSIILTDSIVLGVRKSYLGTLGIPYLLAFDSARTSRGPTMKEFFAFPHGELWATVYTHPRHHGYREYKFEMRDDIFSLGVCLLEIALWKSLFRWNGKKFDVDKEVLDISEGRCRAEALAQGYPQNAKRTWFRQRLLIEAAEELIPPLMGDLFKDIVVACLTFGDPSRITRMEAFQSRIDIRSDLNPEDQSTHFVRDVLTMLCSIKVS